MMMNEAEFNRIREMADYGEFQRLYQSCVRDVKVDDLAPETAEALRAADPHITHVRVEAMTEDEWFAEVRAAHPHLAEFAERDVRRWIRHYKQPNMPVGALVQHLGLVGESYLADRDKGKPNVQEDSVGLALAIMKQGARRAGTPFEHQDPPDPKG